MMSCTSCCVISIFSSVLGDSCVWSDKCVSICMLLVSTVDIEAKYSLIACALCSLSYISSSL